MLQTLLQKRSNGYYYFRWVCPPPIRKLLGKREIIRSLRTTSKFQALARSGAYYMAVEQLRSLYQQYDAGLISGDEYDNRAYETCMQEIAQMLVEGVGEYKPVDLADVKVQKAKVGHAIKMIKDSSITITAEAIEGESAY